MPPIKYNARDIDFEVQDPDNPGTWLPILGVNTFTKSTDAETAETTDFQSQGQAQSEKMELSKTLQLQGSRLKDPTTGAGDPGQVAVETLADRLGPASLGGVRFAAPGDTTWEVWTAHVSMGDEGGGNNDKTSWEATFTRSGASTTAAKS